MDAMPWSNERRARFQFIVWRCGLLGCGSGGGARGLQLVRRLWAERQDDAPHPTRATAAVEKKLSSITAFKGLKVDQLWVK